MILTARSLILLLFGGLLLLRPVGSFFLRAHLHPPGCGHSVMISESIDPDDFVVEGASYTELGKRNQEFKEFFDRDYERATRQIQSIGAYIDRSNLMCIIAGLLLIFAAIPLDVFPPKEKNHANKTRHSNRH